MMRRWILLTGLLACALAATPFPASAATPSPGWTLHSLAAPTRFSTSDTAGCLSLGNNEDEPACDSYQLIITNAGALATSGADISFADQLPAGVTVRKVSVEWPAVVPFAGNGNSPNTDVFPFLVSHHYCTESPLVCSVPFSVASDERIRVVIYVTVDEPDAPGTLRNSASVGGGGAPLVSASSQNPLEGPLPSFGPAVVETTVSGEDGRPESRASAHPYELTTRFGLNSALRIAPSLELKPTSPEDPRDISVDLPLGFLGSALAAPTCTFAELSAEVLGGVGGCPKSTIVGSIYTTPDNNTQVDGPIYNMVPEYGVAAELGYVDGIGGTHALYASVVPTAEGYVLRTTGPLLPQVNLTEIIATFFGDPAAKDGGGTPVPFFTNPADCSGDPLPLHVHLDSWQNPGSLSPDGTPDLSDPAWVSGESPAYPSGVTGCNELHFKPTLAVQPEPATPAGTDSPSGLSLDISVPQTEDPGTLATPPLRDGVVTLPRGMVVNPSSADGLAACSEQQIGYRGLNATNGVYLFDAAPPNCPEASKIGTVELDTPLLPGVLQGAVYLARQGENPFSSLLAGYIVVDDPQTGIVVKIPGELQVDQTTGQITGIFKNNPQFPFSDLKLHFKGGPRATLTTPPTCGHYTTTSDLKPWSAPQSGPDATPESSFDLTSGPGGGACASSESQMPNSPSFEAGTTTATAGTYSPFVLKLSREDGSQRFSSIDATLPEGLLGKLAGLTQCSDAQIAAAAARSHPGDGAAERANPSCPQGSEVGVVNVGAGSGTPFYVQGHAYLAGPYKGAPLSLAVITPATAGPFDLGDVVVRVALFVDETTTQIHAVSDPLPSILDGIPLDVRSIALDMNRPNFTLNPTSCAAKEITGSETSTTGGTAHLSTRFQVGACAALGFAPKLALNLKGGTRRHTFPALKATLTYPKGSYANIKKAQVTLPHSEFLEQGHIGTVCTRVQFAAKSCPKASIYGKAMAISPLLDKPVSGPVYLRSSSNKLPDLVAELNGQIDVTLDGKIDTGKGGGIRNTFQAVPDAPVSKFVLELKGGKKGLLVNSENICAKDAQTTAIADFTAQNGKVHNTTPTVTNSCGKKSKGNKKSSKHK